MSLSAISRKVLTCLFMFLSTCDSGNCIVLLSYLGNAVLAAIKLLLAFDCVYLQVVKGDG